MDYAKIVHDAKARKSEILAELEKLDRLIETASALADATPSTGKPAGKAPPTPRRTSVATPTREAVTTILRERKAPCETRELLTLVRELGVDVGGKDPIATLSARLSNAPEFQIHRGVGWWFTGEPLPGAWSVFDEAAEPPSKEDSAASNTSTGGREDAAALTVDPDRE